ncbi:MAG TPA: transcriptional regulator [Tepidisphaeraceae bacterium]|jgi:DNA-binding MarR family transcriptional regulator
MTVKPDPSPQQARSASHLDQLDPLLQHKSRLGALVLLSTVDALSFSRLKQLLTETDGNLGAQLRKLEEAQYVAVKKEFADRKPVSWYTLTAAGRSALKQHLAAMDALIRSAGV